MTCTGRVPTGGLMIHCWQSHSRCDFLLNIPDGIAFLSSSFRIPMSLIGFEFVFLCLVNKLRVSALCRDQKSSRALNVAL
jgi:hypothetical protein